MSGRLYILTGASGSGKTELLNALINNSKYNIDKAKKYSTRAKRNDNDDIIYKESIDTRNFDLVYNLSNVRYGINYKDIEDQLALNKNTFIIISYVRVIKKLKEHFAGNVSVIYISSAIDSKKLNDIHTKRYLETFKPSENQILKLWDQFKRLKSSVELKNWKMLLSCMSELSDDWKQVLPLNDSLEVRTVKLRDFHKTYLDHIYLFDHVILNYKFDEGDIKGYDMYRQGCNIMEYYQNCSSVSKRKNKPVIFVIAAASVAGKGTLLETINDTLDPKTVSILTKKAKRDQKNSDKRDGMVAIGVNGVFDESFDIRWEFHKENESDKGTEYAISSQEIEKNIKKNNTQIVISNMQQFSMFREKYGNRVVFIYLHRLQSREDKEKYLIEHEVAENAKTKLNESDKVYEDYIEKISEFDHVLLNTSFQEDLYEQIFTLIEHYSNE